MVTQHAMRPGKRDVRTLQHLGHLSPDIQNLRIKGALHLRIMTLMALPHHPPSRGTGRRAGAPLQPSPPPVTLISRFSITFFGAPPRASRICARLTCAVVV